MFIWHALRNWLGLPIDIRNVCVLFAPLFSGVTAWATYEFTKEIKDASAGLLAAGFIAIVPGYISRSVAGSYDNEAIAITLLMVTFMFWIKAQKTGSIMHATCAALFYFYMVSAWGGYVFITNLIPLHVFADFDGQIFVQTVFCLHHLVRYWNCCIHADPICRFPTYQV